ncbi:hypothetical protein ACKKBF_B38650 [Auxenochlorella protothecoides x Auxenochlorella symbiontica]
MRVLGVLHQTGGLLRGHATARAYTNRAACRGQGRVPRGEERAAGSTSVRPSRANGETATDAPFRGEEAVDSRASRPGKVMEVEIKLRLKDEEAHARLAAALKASYRTTHEQENYFFDGSSAELSSARVILRLRFYNFDKKALLTVKGKQVLVDGVGRCPETEVEVPPDQARGYLSDPNRLLEAGLPLVDGLKQQYGLKGLKGLGGFRNVRQEFDWEGLVLELDQTRFDHGTVYELEAETPKPEEVKPKLEALLTKHGVAYADSASSKFANFIQKSLR